MFGPLRLIRPARAAAAGGATLAVVGALLVGSSHPASASPGESSRDQVFADAAAEFGVPVSVLEAVSYAQTRWDAHPGQHNTSGGYGPMNLIDATLFSDQGKDGTTTRRPTKIDSLGRAAKLINVDRDQLRTDPQANIRGGAALLADQQDQLGLPTGLRTDPGRWYATVAASSNASDAASAKRFAADVYDLLADGADRVTDNGTQVRMPATDAEPVQDQLELLDLKPASDSGRAECPPGLGCESIPAPYEEYGDGDYGNHDKAERGRSKDAPSVDYIVLHDTEGSWDTALELVQDKTYLAWHYTIRSEDGKIAQHVPTKDVGWHAGNWYMNAHSIGIEQEGFAAEGATWYTESLYRNSARLVRYLAKKHNVPLDPAHILGHDNVPGTTADNVAGMHWDPGPYWDWEHYFKLLGAPLNARKGPPNKDIVRILPGFDDNQQPVTGCETAGEPCEAQGTNFVTLHAEPNADSPLVKDIGLHPDGSPSTTEVADIGARAVAGQEYAVAGRDGDWTAIWYLGQKAWFHNPADDPTAIGVKGLLVQPKDGVQEVTTYGRAYPESSAYPDGVPDQGTDPLDYKIKSGQAAVLTDATVSTDYYRAVTFDTPPPEDHINIRGETKYLQVSIGHRIAYVKASEVEIVRGPAPPSRRPADRNGG